MVAEIASMPVPSPERSLALGNLIAAIVLSLSLLLLRPEHLMAEGASGVPRRAHPDLGTDGVHWKGKNDLISSLLPRMFSWWWKGSDSADGIILSFCLVSALSNPA